MFPASASWRISFLLPSHLIVKSFSQLKSASESCCAFNDNFSPILPSRSNRCVCSISISQDLFCEEFKTAKSLSSYAMSSLKLNGFNEAFFGLGISRSM